MNASDASYLQCVYKSDRSVRFARPELVRLSREWGARNRDLGLTGLLLGHGALYVAVLEGRQDAVLTRLEAISGDQRHANMEVLYEGVAPRRRFATWFFSDIAPVESDEVGMDGARFASQLARRLRRVA